MEENSLKKISLTKAMTLCSQREYCIADIRNKLALWGLNEKDTDNIISTLIDEKFINESRFATAFTRDKFNYNKWGKIKIRAHLKNKNIPTVVIESALNSIDSSLYIKTLEDLIDVKRRSVKAKNQFDLKAKLLRYGLSKGFESFLLYDLLNKPD